MLSFLFLIRVVQSEKPAKLPISILLFSKMKHNSAHLNKFMYKQQWRQSALHVKNLLDEERVQYRRGENGTAYLIGMYHSTENCSTLWNRPWTANRYPSLATRLCFWSKEDHNSICTVGVMYWVGVVYRTVRTVKFESGHGFLIKRILELFGGWFFCNLFWRLILNEAFKVFDVWTIKKNNIAFQFSPSFFLLDITQNPKSKYTMKCGFFWVILLIRRGENLLVPWLSWLARAGC